MKNVFLKKKELIIKTLHMLLWLGVFLLVPWLQYGSSTTGRSWSLFVFASFSQKKRHPLLEDKRNTTYIIILWEATKSGVLMYLFGAKLNQEKEKYIYSRMTNDSFNTT